MVFFLNFLVKFASDFQDWPDFRVICPGGILYQNHSYQGVIIEDNLSHHILFQNHHFPRGVRLSGLEVGVNDTSNIMSYLLYILFNTLKNDTPMIRSLEIFKFERI